MWMNSKISKILTKAYIFVLLPELVSANCWYVAMNKNYWIWYKSSIIYCLLLKHTCYQYCGHLKSVAQYIVYIHAINTRTPQMEKYNQYIK